MKQQHALLAAVLGAAFSSLARSQPGVAAPAPAVPHDLVVPIHTMPDDPRFGAYGTWAGGRGYKVQFGDAVTFYPRLGRNAPRNLPLTWRTHSVAIGARILVDGDSGVFAGAVNPRRFEYRRGPIVEAYDVRPEGIEQTFVLAAPPAVLGDLVVEGRFETPLLAPPMSDRHAALDFVDPMSGAEVLSYGKAFVVDAAGRKEPITTSFDGTAVRLCVPGAFLRDAVYPVTVDPLTTSSLLNLDGYAAADLAVQNETSNQTHLLAHSLWTSSTDVDMVVYSYRSDWTGGSQLFADLSDGWHSNHPAVAYSGGADRWIVAFERQNTFSQIRLYLHARDNTAFNSGQLVFMSRMASNSHDWKADVGAQLGGTRALVVCQSEFGTAFDPNGTSDVFGRIVDVATGQMVSGALPLAGSTTIAYDRENPTVTRNGHGSSYWQTAWSHRGILLSPPKFVVYTTQVDGDATVRTPVRIDDPAQDAHKVLPKIDGGGGDFLVTYTLADNLGEEFGRSLHATRFRNLYPQIADVRHRSIATATGTERLLGTGIAFDTLTSSHWGIGWYTTRPGFLPRAFVARVGYEAIVTESQFLTTNDRSERPVLAFSGTPHAFAVVDSESNAIRGRHLLYPGEAGTTVVGAGCGSSTVAGPRPFAGNANFYVSLSVVPVGQTAVPLLSFGQGAVPLDFLGMVGCTLHLDPGSLTSLPPRTTTLFGTNVNLPLPETFLGDMFVQWLFTDPAAPGGARVSAAVRVRVR